MRNKSG